MKIAVVIATYRRADGKTPFYLKRALNSVFSQRHTNFEVFLIGDCYSDVKELKGIISQYSPNKLHCFNLDRAVEREKYTDKNVLWCCGGTEAVNIGIDRAFEAGFEYISFLDHDDYWTPYHLSSINEVVKYIDADWICTKSTYGDGSILPKVDREDQFIPFLPTPGGVIRSSVCYNGASISVRPINTFETYGEAIPGDADLWDRMEKYITKNKLVSYLVNKVTCCHEEEGYALNAS